MTTPPEESEAFAEALRRALRFHEDALMPDADETMRAIREGIRRHAGVRRRTMVRRTVAVSASAAAVLAVVVPVTLARHGTHQPGQAAGHGGSASHHDGPATPGGPTRATSTPDVAPEQSVTLTALPDGNLGFPLMPVYVPRGLFLSGEQFRNTGRRIDYHAGGSTTPVLTVSVTPREPTVPFDAAPYPVRGRLGHLVTDTTAGAVRYRVVWKEASEQWVEIRDDNVRLVTLDGLRRFVTQPFQLVGDHSAGLRFARVPTGWHVTVNTPVTVTFSEQETGKNLVVNLRGPHAAQPPKAAAGTTVRVGTRSGRLVQADGAMTFTLPTGDGRVVEATVASDAGFSSDTLAQFVAGISPLR